MSFARKMKRAAERKAPPGAQKSEEKSKAEAGDAVAKWAVTNRELASYLKKTISYIAQQTGKLIGPMDICIPVIHKDQEKWTSHFGASAHPWRYDSGGFSSSSPVLVNDILESAPFFKAQILGEMKEGMRDRPSEQSTIFLVHSDGEVEFFYFQIAKADRAESADELQMSGNSGFDLGKARDQDDRSLLGDLGQHHTDRAQREHDHVGVDRAICHRQHSLKRYHAFGHSEEVSLEHLLHGNASLGAPDRNGLPLLLCASGDRHDGGDDDLAADEILVGDLFAHLFFSHFLTTEVHDHSCLIRQAFAMADWLSSTRLSLIQRTPEKTSSGRISTP